MRHDGYENTFSDHIMAPNGLVNGTRMCPVVKQVRLLLQGSFVMYAKDKSYTKVTPTTTKLSRESVFFLTNCPDFVQ
jgi:hypothetical protein